MNFPKQSSSRFQVELVLFHLEVRYFLVTLVQSPVALAQGQVESARFQLEPVYLPLESAYFQIALTLLPMTRDNSPIHIL